MLGSWGGSPYNTASIQPMRDFDGLWALAAFRFNFVMQNFVQTFMYIYAVLWGEKTTQKHNMLLGLIQFCYNFLLFLAH